MIYDANGRPMRRGIGFNARLQPEPAVRKGTIYTEAIGFEVEQETDEGDGDQDTAKP